MQFIDFFAGIGGFRRGMELAGHECIGFCEFDKYAVASYTSMHLITDEQREYLATLDLKKRQKEILNEEYRNNEWYADDITRVVARNLPNRGGDCWCFGAPCQDFSVAGKRAGLEGNRSSLVGEIFRLLEEQPEENRPEWLIYENVKGMFSSNNGLDFLYILSEMDRFGYDIEWQNINSAWFVPQNRERIYTIGHLRRYGPAKVFPIQAADGKNSVYQIGMQKSKRKNVNQNRLYDATGIAPTLNTMSGGGREPDVALFLCDMTAQKGLNLTDKARCLESRYNKGVANRNAENSGVVVPIILEGDMQNNLKATPQFIDLNYGAGINLTDNARALQSRYYKGVCGRTGETSGVAIEIEADEQPEKGLYVQFEDGTTVYAVWYEKYQCYIAIRKLTPKECFRLQGWSDDYFEKAAFVNSDSQLYKQAGNGVTVPVAEAVGNAINHSKDGES